MPPSWRAAQRRSWLSKLTEALAKLQELEEGFQLLHVGDLQSLGVWERELALLEAREHLAHLLFFDAGLVVQLVDADRELGPGPAAREGRHREERVHDAAAGVVQLAWEHP